MGVAPFGSKGSSLNLIVTRTERWSYSSFRSWRTFSEISGVGPHRFVKLTVGASMCASIPVQGFGLPSSSFIWIDSSWFIKYLVGGGGPVSSLSVGTMGLLTAVQYKARSCQLIASSEILTIVSYPLRLEGSSLFLTAIRPIHERGL